MDPRFLCSICMQAFNKISVYHRHLRTHDGHSDDEMFECPFCSSKLRRKGNFLRHMAKFHSNEIGSTEAEAVRHVKEEEEEESADQKGPDLTSSTEPISPVSSLMAPEPASPDPENLQNLKSESPVSPASTSSPEGKYSCELCLKRFFKKSLYNKHLVTHTGEGKVQCPICNYNFSRRDNALRHLRKYHKIANGRDREILSKTTAPTVPLTPNPLMNLVQQAFFAQLAQMMGQNITPSSVSPPSSRPSSGESSEQSTSD